MVFNLIYQWSPARETPTVCDGKGHHYPGLDFIIVQGVYFLVLHFIAVVCGVALIAHDTVM